MERPVIVSEWRTLLSPRKFGKYVNDHTLYYDGRWHLVGITSKEGVPSHERYFVHAEGSTLREPLRETCKVIDNGTRAWAPCVIEDKGLFYMFYGPSPTKLAVSFDSGDWFGQEVFLRGVPPMACHRDHFVLPIGEHKWVMYIVGVKNRKSAISCLVSDDLIHWDFYGYALDSGPHAPLNPSWGAFESPFVVRRGNLFYLFTTYTDCSPDNYHNTLVFCSDSPFSFGTYDGPRGSLQPVANLRCHAPEVVRENGQWFITTCGWRKSSFTGGKVGIARLKWEKILHKER